MRLERRLGYETEGRRLHAHACRLRPQRTYLVWSGALTSSDKWRTRNGALKTFHIKRLLQKAEPLSTDVDGHVCKTGTVLDLNSSYPARQAGRANHACTTNIFRITSHTICFRIHKRPRELAPSKLAELNVLFHGLIAPSTLKRSASTRNCLSHEYALHCRQRIFYDL